MPHEPGSGKPDPILVTDHVLRRFGGLTAVDVGHVEVQRGSITALIGPNGAGKTTFFNLLTGFDRPDQGSWTFNGKSLEGTPAYKVARGGMVRTFQLTKALSKLTVIENMRLGAVGQRGENVWRAMFPGFWRNQEDDITGRAEELLARFQLDAKRDDFAGSLSGGQRKLLEMARALMVEPEMVMLDEPMAGVNPALTQSLLGPRQGPARAGHDGAVRGTRHGHGARHLRLGVRHGPGQGDRRRPRRLRHVRLPRDRRLPRCPPRPDPPRRDVIAEIEQEAAAELAAEQAGPGTQEEDR